MPVNSYYQARLPLRKDSEVPAMDLPRLRTLVPRRESEVTHLDLVVITWLDHTSMDGWQTNEDSKKLGPQTITSVGWLNHDPDQGYSIISCISTDGDVSCQQFILRSATIDVYRVPQPKKPGKPRVRKRNNNTVVATVTSS